MLLWSKWPLTKAHVNYLNCLVKSLMAIRIQFWLSIKKCLRCSLPGYSWRAWCCGTNWTKGRWSSLCQIIESWWSWIAPDWHRPSFFPRESVGFLGREESWVPPVCRDLRVSPVHLVQMGQRYCAEASPACSGEIWLSTFTQVQYLTRVLTYFYFYLSISIYCYLILLLHYI